ncbi:MAG: aspartate/glutamate racemase family protein [Spirochaetota bacterium]|nr:aspartate/glutamate racemase family protein [Spirochaetota bacterium]
MIVKGGFTTYGEPIGILMLETKFARPAGDIGNAGTFDFPVKYRIVKGASPARVVKERDSSLIEPFIRAGRELQREGVKAVTTSCGFLALFQEEIASALEVPFFSSSLLQVPLVWRMLGRKGTIGILTVRRESLGEDHFRAVGIDEIPLVIDGMDGSEEFSRVFMNCSLDDGDPSLDLDYDQAADEMRRAAGRLKERVKEQDQQLGAVIMECTNMPPFRSTVREILQLPVFDIVTLTRFVYSSL